MLGRRSLAERPTVMGRDAAFPLDRYLDASRTLSLDEYDWTRATAHPLSPELARALLYMLRIEAQTLFYVRDLLNTRTAYIPEISSFLTVWLYEEERHSRIFKRFLKEHGHEVAKDDHARVREASGSGPREWAEAFAAKWMSRATPHFVAVHMTWGAYQELSTIHAYERLGRRANHPFLRELCESIAKDERRHFAFYYNQAMRRLAPPFAQKLTRTLLEHWWKPVGFGVHSPEHCTFMVDWFFGDGEGLEQVRRMDETMGKLPGLAGLGLYAKFCAKAKEVIADRSRRGLGFDDWVDQAPGYGLEAPAGT
jgi:rubrerythrin